MNKIKILMLAALGMPFLLTLVGCSKQDDGMKPEEQQMVSRLEEIVKKSGGEWDKLSDADRNYLINDISHGSEPSARMLLSARSGKLKATPGGPKR